MDGIWKRYYGTAYDLCHDIYSSWIIEGIDVHVETNRHHMMLSHFSSYAMYVI